ncbi:hypothetical protein ACFOZY_06040 [Chungangia koreensis]|uniref:Uncharacterized protein n=1 Tax=Chungangia koreensis TaxID=752657 RepID=A0ABV8X3X7_9LACT
MNFNPLSTEHCYCWNNLPILGIGLAFPFEYFDSSKIKTEQDIEKILELSVIGTISEMDMKVENKLMKKQKKQKGKRGMEWQEEKVQF